MIVRRQLQKSNPTTGSAGSSDAAPGSCAGTAFSGTSRLPSRRFSCWAIAVTMPLLAFACSEHELSGHFEVSADAVPPPRAIAGPLGGRIGGTRLGTVRHSQPRPEGPGATDRARGSFSGREEPAGPPAREEVPGECATRSRLLARVYAMGSPSTAPTSMGNATTPISEALIRTAERRASALRLELAREPQ